MSNTYNTKVPVPSGSVPSATLSKGQTKDAPGSAMGKLGGAIPGFGGGAPDASTVNGNSARSDGNFGSISGNLGKTQSDPSDSSIKGFSTAGIKPGKI